MKTRFAFLANAKEILKAEGESPKRYEWILGLGILLISAFFFCFYKDFHLTVEQSLDFLDCLFHGKLFHFYSEINRIALSGGYGADWPASLLAGANYSVINYAVLGIFCLPFYIIDVILPGDLPFLVYECWLKIGYVVLFIWMVGIFDSIFKELGLNDGKRRRMDLCFFTSPIFLYASIMITHMDIFSIFFLLYGMLYMYRGKTRNMLIFFMLAVTFKPFAILGILPILFLKEKRILFLARNLVLVVAGVLLQGLVFHFDPGYGESQAFMSKTYDFVGRFFAVGYKFERNAFEGKAAYFVIGYVVLLVMCYCIRKATKYDLVVFPLGSMILFFLFVMWHPNWAVLIVPFLVIWMGITSEFRVAAIIETVYMSMLLILSSFGWEGFYDIEILNGGVIPTALGLNVNANHHMANVVRNRLGNIPEDMVPSLFAAALMGILVVIAFDLYRGRRTKERFQGKAESKAEPLAIWVRVLPLMGYIGLCFISCGK